MLVYQVVQIAVLVALLASERGGYQAELGSILKRIKSRNVFDMREREVSACLISVQALAHLVLFLCIVCSLCEDRSEQDEPVIMASAELEQMLRRD